MGLTGHGRPGGDERRFWDGFSNDPEAPPSVSGWLVGQTIRRIAGFRLLGRRNFIQNQSQKLQFI